MNIKILLFRLSIAIATFVLGISFFCAWQWLPTLWQTQKFETVQTSDLPPKTTVTTNFQTKPIVTTNFQTTLISDQNTSEPEPAPYRYNLFEQGGYYYIIGKTPKAFADFTDFYIELWDYDEKKEELFMVPPTGYIDAKETFKFKRIFLGKKDISFETEKVGGISYQFTGKLLDQPEPIKDDEIYLEGHLKKFKNGKIIAESDFKFGWTVGC